MRTLGQSLFTLFFLIIFVPTCLAGESIEASLTANSKTKLESRSLSDVEGSPIQSMLLPGNWKREGGDRTEEDFWLESHSQVSFSFKPVKNEPVEYCCVNGFNNPVHDALVKLCNRGPRLIFSSVWQKEVGWGPKDKRYQNAVKEFGTISRCFFHTSGKHNQLVNAKNPDFLLDELAVKKIGGKLVLFNTGVSLDAKKQPREYISELFVPAGHWSDFRVRILAHTEKDNHDNKVLIDEMLSSIHWTGVAYPEVHNATRQTARATSKHKQ
jgi:hypothetical protein